MLSKMNQGNNQNNKNQPFRRNRADTLPSMNTGASFAFKPLNDKNLNSSNANSTLSSNTSTPFRSRLSSFTLGGAENGPPFSKLGSWEDPFKLPSIGNGDSTAKNPSNLTSHYESSAAKTLDFLGLNEDLASQHIPIPKSNVISNRRSRAMTMPGNNALNTPFSKSNRPPSMTTISDGESENTAHSPTSGQSIGSEALKEADEELNLLSLKIENLSLDTSLSKLTVEVSKYGDVESIQLVKKEGVGYVTFSSADEAKAAIQGMNDSEFLDSTVKVQYHKKDTCELESRMRISQNNNFDPSQSSQYGASGGQNNDSNSNFYNKVLNYYNRQADDFKLAVAEVSTRGLKKHELLMSYEYAVTLPPIPNPNFKKKVEPTRLRELRKQLESDPTREIVDQAYEETQECWVDLCSDYIGNIIIQKLIEHGSELQKTSLILSVAPYMAAIGIHKNGTWAIQKMIECADSEAQIIPIAAALKPFTPALLLDQFGNYVVQCCLKFDSPHNQFIFDSIYSRCSEIAQGRYGARAIRTCLDSQFTTPIQKELVSEALMRNSYSLSTNANGSLLLNWILDSQHTEHYLGIVVNLSGHLAQLCCHKLASSIIVRLVNQQLDLQAREYLLYKLFFQSSGPVIKDILTDHSQGNQFVQKILNSPYLDEDTKASIQMAVNTYSTVNVDPQHLIGYRRLLFDETLPFGPHSLPSQSMLTIEQGFSPFTTVAPVQEQPGAWSWGWSGQPIPAASFLPSQINPSPSMFHSGTSYFTPGSGPVNSSSYIKGDNSD